MVAAALTMPPTSDETAIMDAMRGFFDAAWYLERYPDIAQAGVDPLRHFIAHGADEGRDPNPWFDSAWYTRHYPDVAASGLNPLLHYMKAGARELRNPHPRFDAVWYADENPDAAGNPLLYHLRIGIERGLPTERPLDIRDYLPSAHPPFPDRVGVAVDVVIPAYRGLAQTRACLESVLADPDRPPGRIIVVDDCSPEPALSAWLAREAKAGKFHLVRNPRNLGFVASANRGMQAAGTHDVVLLNSDTEVPAGWLRRLMAQAYAEPRIASVSPFSNNATICGYPGNTGGPMPFGCSLAEIDGLCRMVNAGRAVPVPTTVGYCMYIRRAALDAVGLFDERVFGRGYGEENDFCLRASKHGWQHRLACDTFVYHEGSVSFGDTMNELTREALGKLRARHPDYEHIVSRHIAIDRVGPFRFAVTAALFRTSGRPTILLVSHGLGGGAARHVQMLVERFEGKANFLMLAATARGAELSVPAVADHPTLLVQDDRAEELLQILRFAAVRRVHIHHLAGFDLDVRAVIRQLDVPFDVTVHDYFALCPQTHLLPRPEGLSCGEPGPAACNACIAQRPSHGATDIAAWRGAHAWMYLDADRVLCPSADVRDRLVRHGLGARAIVAPHEPVPPGDWSVSAPPVRGNTLRVALLGVLARHKGAHLVAALATEAAGAGLELHLVGHVEENFPEEIRPLLRETGRYEEKDLPALLKKVKPHVVWLPSACPETYSYTLTAALAQGLPVVASRIGAFPERLEGRPLTWLVEPSVATADWLGVFETVRATLRKTSGAARGPRPPVPDFYATDYLPSAPSAPSLLPRRPRVVVVPERFETGALSPCAFIRLIQPLNHPAIAGGFEVVIADDVSALHERADIFVTQRYAVSSVEAADALARHAKSVGGTLLYDLDDDLLHIPRSHPDADELRPRAKVVQRLIQVAGRVWASTEPLAASLRRLRDGVDVIPNGLDERLWCDGPPRFRTRQGPVRILSMGTATHDGDFAIIAPALERLARDFDTAVEIEMIGVLAHTDPPAGVHRVGTPVHAARSYPGFVDWITQEPAWDIGLAPLVDSAFNRGKSSIKTLDYAAQGMAVLASDVPAYRTSLASGEGGMLLPADPDRWYAALSWLIRDTVARKRMAAAAHTAFLAEGTLAAQAGQRQAAWQSLLKPVSEKPTAGKAPAVARGTRRREKAAAD